MTGVKEKNDLTTNSEEKINVLFQSLSSTPLKSTGFLLILLH